MQRSLIDTALAAHAAGFYVLPPMEDGSKRPQYEGDHWASRRDAHGIKTWYANGRHGIGIVTGAASGIELFEFDDGTTYEEYKRAAYTCGYGPLVERIERGYCERTPSGGIHWFYRYETERPSTKLARRASDKKALIETKGHAGYAIIAPTGGPVHETGRSYELLSGAIETICSVTDEERRDLYELARAFDQAPQREMLREKQPPRSIDGSKPGDDYCNRVDWRDILEPHGWQAIYQRGGITYWRRPGKRVGISASTNYADSDLFYVFSTSTEFESERGYNKFSAYALLFHDGDFHTAARQLISEGYGRAVGPRVVIGSKGRAQASDYVPEREPSPAPLKTDTWLDCYCDYAAKVSPMTPRTFHESAGLWLISTAIARRLCVPMEFATIYPNIWTMWLAPTTLYRKSTAMDIAKGIARHVYPHLLASQEMSVEGFTDEMAGYEPKNLGRLTTEQKQRWEISRNYAAQKGLILDECSGLLAGAGRDYNAGLIETLLRCFDCDPEYTRTTRSQGLVIIRNASLSMLGASTPAAMSTHLVNERLWSMGWWPRFGIVCAPEERPAWQEPIPAKEPSNLRNELHRLANRLPVSTWIQPAGALHVHIDDDARRQWGVYNKWCSYDCLGEGLDQRLYGTYGRLPTQALKVAMLLTAMDWPDADERPCITAAHMGRAIDLIEAWRLGAHRALVVATQTEEDVLTLRVIKQLGKAGQNGLTMRDLAKGMKDVNRSALLLVIDQLQRTGEIEQIKPDRKGTKGGRPTEGYRLVAD